MLKQAVDIDLPIMTQIINKCIDNNCYSKYHKLAKFSPVCKKEEWFR